MTTTPPAPYVGGKRLLAKTLIERINQIEHTGYAEPFVGMKNHLTFSPKYISSKVKSRSDTPNCHWMVRVPSAH